LDSTIIENQNKLAIYELCNFPSIKKWNLQYRASRDGFDAEEFHKRCDGIANTLTVIKSEHGNIFGGFTEKAWDSSGECYEDPEAFIFSLVNKENKPFKVMCTNGFNAIICESSLGPSFGGQNGDDILICSNSHVNKSSLCNFGSSYKHVDYPNDEEHDYQNDEEQKTMSILAGSYDDFQILEIEVFVCTN
jgi:hypothetical protein